MRTSIFLDPSESHERIVELNKARVDFQTSHPQAMPGYFSYKGESWHETANGHRMTISRSIRELPLFFKGLPIHMIELEDSVEDLNGTTHLTPGIYKVGGTRAEVDSYISHNSMRTVYTIKIEGKSLRKINDLYTKIRQSQATPTEVWDLVAPSI